MPLMMLPPLRLPLMPAPMRYFRLPFISPLRLSHAAIFAIMPPFHLLMPSSPLLITLPLMPPLLRRFDYAADVFFFFFFFFFSIICRFYAIDHTLLARFRYLRARYCRRFDIDIYFSFFLFFLSPAPGSYLFFTIFFFRCCWLRYAMIRH